jgi:ubiquinone/menaquinone biosynthesis C-methylase UbiE
MKILDVGCGSGKFKNSIGIDRIPLTGVDVVIDLNNFPWPFEDNYFDRLIFKHSIAHLNDILLVMEEAHRVAKPDAVIDILTPHFSCDNYFTDPTHKHPMGYRSMNYVCDNVKNWKYKYTNASFDLLKAYISFGEYKIDFNIEEYNKRVNIHKIFGFEYLVNRVKRIYEKFFSFILPASEVYFQLKVNKKEKK